MQSLSRSSSPFSRVSGSNDESGLGASVKVEKREEEPDRSDKTTVKNVRNKLKRTENVHCSEVPPENNAIPDSPRNKLERTRRVIKPAVPKTESPAYSQAPPRPTSKLPVREERLHPAYRSPLGDAEHKLLAREQKEGRSLLVAFKELGKNSALRQSLLGYAIQSGTQDEWKLLCYCWDIQQQVDKVGPVSDESKKLLMLAQELMPRGDGGEDGMQGGGANVDPDRVRQLDELMSKGEWDPQETITVVSAFVLEMGKLLHQNWRDYLKTV
jgi:hypothetical protein